MTKIESDISMILAEILQNGYEQGLKHKDQEWVSRIQEKIDYWSAIEGMGGLVAELEKLLEDK